MLPLNRIPTHPGEILQEEFLQPLNITEVTFAGHLTVPVQEITEIIDGQRSVTPQMAWLFAQAFKTTPEFWLNLQRNYDLATCRPEKAVTPLLQAA